MTPKPHLEAPDWLRMAADEVLSTASFSSAAEWWIYRAAHLPKPETAPAQFADVVLLDPDGRTREIVTVVFRTDPAGGTVVTGHSGAQMCDECGRPISPLESIVLEPGRLETDPIDPRWGFLHYTRRAPRLLHDVPCFRSLGRLRA